MTSIDIRTTQRQTQTLSPRLQHAVRLLQMSSLDFAAMVRDTLGRNPFLETEEGEGDGEDGLPYEAAAGSEAALPATLADGAGPELGNGPVAAGHDGP